MALRVDPMDFRAMVDLELLGRPHGSLRARLRGKTPGHCRTGIHPRHIRQYGGKVEYGEKNETKRRVVRGMDGVYKPLMQDIYI